MGLKRIKRVWPTGPGRRGRLEDAPAAGGADAEDEAAVAEDLGGGDNEIDPPSRPDAIGAVFFQVEPAAHIIEEDAGIARRHGGAEATAEGLGDGDDIAVAGGGGEMSGHAPVESLGVTGGQGDSPVLA